FLGMLLEGFGVDARYFGIGAELDLRDLESLAHLLQRDGGGGVDALGVEASLAEAGGERHRETAGMRRADQLLGVRAGRAFEAGAERILPFKCAAPQLHAAAAVLQVSVPRRFRVPRWHKH